LDEYQWGRINGDDSMGAKHSRDGQHWQAWAKGATGAAAWFKAKMGPSTALSRRTRVLHISIKFNGIGLQGNGVAKITRFV
jgi:hypothetical protein